MEQNLMSLSVEERIAYINKNFPFVPHTNAGRLYTTVRRMKAEKELEIPISRRFGAAISVRTGQHANEMDEASWEDFYNRLTENLKRDYPNLWELLNPNQ